MSAGFPRIGPLDVVQVLLEEYERLPKEYRNVLEGAGPPMYVHHSLRPLLVARKERTEVADPYDLGAQLVSKVRKEAVAIVQRQQAMPLISAEWYAPDPDTVVAYTVLLRPAQAAE